MAILVASFGKAMNEKNHPLFARLASREAINVEETKILAISIDCNDVLLQGS